VSEERLRLFLDIETSPLQVFVWQLGDLHVDYKSIIKDRAIICICWKWEGEQSVQYLTWDRRQNDKAMLKEFIPVIDSATEIVMHNGDRFDLPWIRGRAMLHGLPMRPSYTTVDTLKLSRKQFKLPSNRLDALGRQLLGEQKLTTGFGLWRDICLDKCPESLKKMVEYCQQDVLLLEKFYNKIAPYIKPTTSIARYASDCPWCGSSKTGQHNRIKLVSGRVNISFRCRNCAKYHTIPESRLKSNKELSAA